MTMFMCHCGQVHDSAVQGYCVATAVPETIEYTKGLLSFAVDVIDACDAEAKSLRSQLAAMTAARDEACEIAKQSTYCLFDSEERGRRHTRIEELRKVGQ